MVSSSLVVEELFKFEFEGAPGQTCSQSIDGKKTCHRITEFYPFHSRGAKTNIEAGEKTDFVN